MTIRNLILAWARARQPDFVIGGAERAYLRRHWLIPRNTVFNIYVHEFLRSDDDRALHTHPWLFNCSWLLEGQYREHTPKGTACRCAGDWKFRWGAAAHRVELLTISDFVSSQPDNYQPVPCWTLFVTGPRVRSWGFLCAQGFVHWKKFTAPGDKGAVGKGCDQ